MSVDIKTKLNWGCLEGVATHMVERHQRTVSGEQDCVQNPCPLQQRYSSNEIKDEERIEKVLWKEMLIPDTLPILQCSFNNGSAHSLSPSLSMCSLLSTGPCSLWAWGVISEHPQWRGQKSIKTKCNLCSHIIDLEAKKCFSSLHTIKHSKSVII